MKGSFDVLCEAIGFIVLLCVAWKVLALVFGALYGRYHERRYGYEPVNNDEARKVNEQIFRKFEAQVQANDRQAKLERERKAKETEAAGGEHRGRELDPEFLKLATELAVTYAEAGEKRFAVFARHTKEEMGDVWHKVKPYLHGAWSGAAMSHPGIEELTREQAASQIEAIDQEPKTPRSP